MKKKILLIGTGGTIASEISENGLTPELTSEQLLKYIPDIFAACQIDCLQIFSLDSSNLQPKHWCAIAEAIRLRYWEYDGFVICHGTDTMAYTAAALSYLIQGSQKPIVLTGAQKPIGFETTDSKQNLRDAVETAMSDMAGVMVVFHGKIIMGTRAKKTRSKSFEAFSSINFPLLGQIQDGQMIQYIPTGKQTGPKFFSVLNEKVALLRLIPGMDAGVAEYLLANNDALVIESFGVGGLPAYGEKGGFYEVVKTGLEAGKTVVMTTQVENEGSDLSVYRVGVRIKHTLPILEAYDMTTEAVIAKLMWILGQTKDRTQVETLFYTAIASDILVKQRTRQSIV